MRNEAGPEHLGRARRLVGRPALEGLFHRGRPLRARLATRRVAIAEEEVRLLARVEFKLQRVDPELQPRSNQLAHRRHGWPVKLGCCVYQDKRRQVSG